MDDFVAQIISLEISLCHVRARMDAANDPEALHDLRLAVLRLRSLLRPFGDRRICAAAVGSITEQKIQKQ